MSRRSQLEKERSSDAAAAMARPRRSRARRQVLYKTAVDLFERVSQPGFHRETKFRLKVNDPANQEQDKAQ